MANIGVKYCGQCNSFMRLREVYEALVAMDSGNSYDHFYDPANEYDALVVLCGCSAQCATAEGDYPIYHFSPDANETPQKMAERVYRKIKEK